MNAISTPHASSFHGSEVKVQRAAQGNEPGVFTDIYLEETNIVIWQRELSKTLKKSAGAFLKSNPVFQASMTVTPQSVLSSVSESLADTTQRELSKNIAELVNMFCYLFELKWAELRLTALDRAMRPKFHIDNVPCRLVTTYQGIATEWLSNQAVNREKLGTDSNNKPDNQSGLYKSQHDIRQLGCGDAALLKGELWEGNENVGLVHRSPALKAA
jgi:hypothetical protein